MDLRTLLVLGSALSFIGYGAHCLTAEAMRLEFERYGLAHLRALTGILEILGGVGLVVGLWWPLALRVSAGGLAALMVFALIARYRVNDALFLWLPAFALLLVNVFILVSSLRERS